jgi:hypothetical protein
MGKGGNAKPLVVEGLEGDDDLPDTSDRVWVEVTDATPTNDAAEAYYRRPYEEAGVYAPLLRAVGRIWMHEADWDDPWLTGPIWEQCPRGTADARHFWSFILVRPDD